MGGFKKVGKVGIEEDLEALEARSLVFRPRWKVGTKERDQKGLVKQQREARESLVNSSPSNQPTLNLSNEN